MKIKAGWSGTLVKNGTLKNVFTCSSCGFSCIKTLELSDPSPKNCANTGKRKEKEEEEKMFMVEGIMVG